MRVETGPNDFYRLRFVPSYVVESLKYNTPTPYRFWDGEKNYGDNPCWYVHKKYLLTILKLAYYQGRYVDYSDLPIDWQIEIAKEKQGWKVGFQSDLKPYTSSLDKAYEDLYLLPDAPFYLVEAVWKKLAQKHHPDRGGDESEFKIYSEAYRRIKEEQ